ncbi:hypothetical protein AJ80_09563 [Polytolypa hystricis UAMH7299]|uniref:Potassium transport protein n=1 Tax=Polytolypa hystricis (strain UAMH7299) TaxID=1447883 RepID=A0A2B7WNV1_POLH7|nr:hypothetical protein AJ80_09563 [Polytolypa hystricis UAMH7299]
MLRSTWKYAKAIKPRIPVVRSLGFNFISIHYAYIISCALAISVVIYPGGRMRYIDALFFGTGSATQSGLNTLDVNLLRTYQQVGLYFGSMITNPIVVHSCVVFVRLYWFERRFQHVVRDAKDLRRTKSRARTVTDDAAAPDLDREERGVAGQKIVVVRNNAGEAGRKMEEHEVMKPDPESPSDTDGSTRQNGDNSSSSDRTDQPETLEHNGSLGVSPHSTNDAGIRLPVQLSPEQHIAFLENQRKERGALRIPSPREFDRGGAPQSLDEPSDGGELGRKQTSQSERSQGHRSMDNSATKPVQPTPGQHITIDEPGVFRARSRNTTFPRADSRRTASGARDRDEPAPRAQRRNTLSTLLRTVTRQEDVDPSPYLSWEPTIGRNSAFIDLTESQRDELGGIEYRALKTLAIILISYFFFFHLLGIVCLVPWIMNHGKYGDIVKKYGQGRPWWAIFSAASSFNDQGFTITPDSMVSFYGAIFPLLLMSFLIVIGNTGFPCMLRFIIWMFSKMVPKGSAVWEELRFLLDHPRRCFTLLFPRAATWWLFGILIILNGVDLIFFIILDLNDPDVTSIPPGIRFVDGLFQATATRTAGLSVISLSTLHPAIQVSYLIMMYISVFPIAISMRRTNVYEERSLGIYYPADEDEDGVDQGDRMKEPSYVGAHLRKQLSFDLWFVFLGLFIIAIVEGHRLENTNQSAFTMFSVLFEIVSAYGTVGLSLGYPNKNYAFSGEFRSLSKLVIIAMEIRGRHRGLPYALDRAVLLPSETLHQKEMADANRRIRRRGSGLSTGSAWTTGQVQGGVSNWRDEMGSSSAVAPPAGRSLSFNERIFTTPGNVNVDGPTPLRSDAANVVSRLSTQREE